MKMPRITIRRLMIAVALVAPAIWPAIVATKWDGYRRRADQHEETARTLSSEILGIRERGGTEGQAKMREEALFRESREAGRFRRAMHRPWAKPEPSEMLR